MPPESKDMTASNNTTTMKKLNFLLLAFVWAAAFTACSKDEIPDPNAPTGLPALLDPDDVCSCMDDLEFMRYCYRNFDTDKNGKVSRAEADAVTEMDLTEYRTSLRSITGIGYFTNLRTIIGAGCCYLETVDLSNNRKITSIQKNAFQNCGMTNVLLPNSVTSIGDEAFAWCGQLASITLPNRVTSIGERAFYGCHYMESIHMPDGVTSIGKSAFEGCRDLTDIRIPKGLTQIGDRAFYYCSYLTGDIKIPDKVKTIGAKAFAGCYNLTGIAIGNGTTAIGSEAFYDCYNITSVTIGKHVTSIGSGTFFRCSNLNSIKIPEEVTVIGYWAFCDCDSLVNIYCKPTVPPTLGRGAFNYIDSSAKIYVPAASVEAYKTAKGWSEYASRIEGF